MTSIPKINSKQIGLWWPCQGISQALTVTNERNAEGNEYFTVNNLPPRRCRLMNPSFLTLCSCFFLSLEKSFCLLNVSFLFFFYAHSSYISLVSLYSISKKNFSISSHNLPTSSSRWPISTSPPNSLIFPKIQPQFSFPTILFLLSHQKFVSFFLT